MTVGMKMSGIRLAPAWRRAGAKRIPAPMGASVMSSDPCFQTLFADRIGGANYGKGTEIYKFEKIKRAKRAAIAAHPERVLLDFGIGENDDMADPLVREVAKKEIDKLENRGYADNGIAAFKESAAAFMRKGLNVTLDRDKE